jgi:polysaccharide deacetylase 2 family uncharacterized protein YibQ
LSSDELNTPLGQDNGAKKRRKLPISAPQIVAGVLGLFALAVVGAAAFRSDPLGGEPVAVVAAPPGSDAPAVAASGDGQHHDRYDGPAPGAPKAAPAAPPADQATAEPPPGANTVTIIDGSSGKRQQVVIPGSVGSGAGSVGASPAPKAPLDKRLLEVTPQGAIPQIGPDGTRAYAQYAKPRKLPANRTDAPKIAIVVGGLGISASATADALAKLPPAVSLAFAPYANGLDALADRARAQGHEVLLQIPMEPFDYPNNDPGPRALLTTLDDKQNMERLHWLMARLQGYVGVIGYMGGKFTASEAALTPVMRDVGKRGLLYVDDGTSPRSVAGQLAGGNSVPFTKADIVLDTVPSPLEIARSLARLEIVAREHGSAVGFTNAQPAAIADIAAWAKAVEARGFVLVPITMVTVKEKSS